MPEREQGAGLSVIGAAAIVPLLLADLGLLLQGRAHDGHAGRENVVRLTVRTPRSGFNRLVLSVTVCEPDRGRCATIDDVMVDTGSTGLRLEASAVPSWLRLPSLLGPDHQPLAECLHFVHDDAWGLLYRADVRMGGLTAPRLPVQIIADGDDPQPASCPRSTVRPTSNGTLGLSPDLTDCRGPCRQDPSHPGYYTCRDGTCVPVQGDVEPAYRLPNPVPALPRHNNGFVVELPAAPPGGAAEIAGTLTFGVGTSATNQLGASHVLPLDGHGRYTTVHDGRRYPASIIDSGTETYVLADDHLPRCESLAWAYCADPERQLESDMIGDDGARFPMRFEVGDYRAIRDRRVGVSDRLAVAADPASPTFVWGAPFFMGKRVSIVLDGKAVPGASGLTGPLYGILPLDGTGHID